MPTTDARPPRTARAHVLSNGRFVSWLDERGRCGSTCDGLALTRPGIPGFAPAPGMAWYVRDLDSGRTIAIGARGDAPPVPRPGAPGSWTLGADDEGLALVVTAWIAPGTPAECRRLTLANASARPRRLELTGCAEVALHHVAADAAHPSFSKLFVQTEWREEWQALVARRRPRDADERFPRLVLALDGPGTLSFETDRLRFLGRGGSWRRAAAMAPGAALSGTVGNVLDPVLALRRRFELAPGARAEFRSLLLVAPAGAARPADLDALRAEGAFDASLGDAERDEAARRRAADLDAPAAAAAQDLLVRLVRRDPGLRADAPRIAFPDAPAATTRALPPTGPRGRAPRIVVDARGDRGGERRAEAIRLRAYARALGVPCAWFVLEGGPPPPEPPAAEDLVFVDAADLGGEDLARLAAGASAWLARPVADLSAHQDEPVVAVRERAAAPEAASAAAAPDAPPLRHFNGYGGFTAAGDAYVIRLRAGGEAGFDLPPAPWVNVISNPGFGCLVSETGAGFTWSGNSREHRLTHWSNDPVLDPHSEALYVRDEADGAFWSPQPGPVSPGVACQVTHRPGATTWELACRGLRQRTTVSVASDAPVRIASVEITNLGAAARRVRLVQALRFVLGNAPDPRGVVTEVDRALALVRACRPWDSGDASAVAWVSVVAPDGTATAAGDDLADFLGPAGDLARPLALATGRAVRDAERGDLDAGAVVEAMFEIPAGASRTCTFLLGEEPDRGAVARRRAALAAPRALERVRDAALEGWSARSARLRIRTPEPALDAMVNHWLPYQNLSCRMWGRSAFYQSGGAFGFRDQLQDASAMVWLDPALTREQILLHAAHQFVEGDVLHWWHPPRSRGIRTRFADDLLWLPWIAAFYADTTGDASIWDEEVRFLSAPALVPGEQERYLEPSDSGERASVYEHAARAIDRSLATGAHGFPLFGCGDWNDGMNRVGEDGRGESVWMAFFLHAAIESLAPVAERRGERERASRWREHRARLGQALESAGWDGAWYRRGYYGDGTPLGSAASDECRIDALAQAWSVISGAVPRERAEIALASALRLLVSEDERLVRLLAPPFEHTPHDPGYIKGYVPGVRENGGQYTHAALWVVRAMAELGWRDRAARTLAMLSPVAHGGDPDSIARYRVEPYVIAADVYGAPPHVGRGGWTWYTGSAGWMYRVAVESVLGLHVEGGTHLTLVPCLPDEWPQATIEWKVPGSETRLLIRYRNPGGCAAAVRSATLDGVPLDATAGELRLPLPRDGAEHELVVTLGAAPAP